MDINIEQNQTLYALLLSVVIFLSAFVLFVQLIPPEAYNPYKTYANSFTPSDTSPSDLNIFTYYQNITLTINSATTKAWFNETEVHFEWFDDPFSSEVNATVFSIHHFEWDWWIIPKDHGFKSTDGDEFDYHFATTGRDENWFSHKWLLRHYDNRTDHATASMTCGHITLKLTFTSNSSSYTLPEALTNEAPIHIIANWEFDFSHMGSNIWSLLGAVLTFQSIVTGITVLDAVLNSLISIPVWTAIVYIFYRIITGMIPTVSGGGGA